MKNTILLMLAMLTGISFTAVGQKKMKKDLNGRTFEITLTSSEKKAPKWKEDEISFHANKLKSMELFQKDKFADAPCTITKDTSDAENPVFTFEATGKNTSGSEVKWEGKVEGENISGTATMTNKKGSFEYSFEGALKGSKTASGGKKGKK